MNVRFQIRWKIIAQNDGNISDIKASRSHVGRNQNLQIISSKRIQCSLSHLLRFIAVNGRTSDIHRLQFHRQHIRGAFRIGKYQTFPVLTCNLFHILQKLVQFLHLAAQRTEALLNVAVCVQFRTTNLHSNRIAHVTRRDLLYLLWPRRTPHQCLFIRTDIRQNALQIVAESHIQHSVCFVQHAVRRSFEVRFSALQQIQQSPRSRNQYIRRLS
mmetsp:Transcript_24760/g.39317  ORF Transcript_24760/g.39317 Transcript_24760/m.39317 type:complete len:214 (+) Transcript_24760:441-1082(+)